MLLRDLVLIRLVAAVADHDGSSDLFQQGLAHHAILILDHIEIGDVDDVIAVHGVGDVDGLRISGALHQLHVAGSNLLLAFLVTMRADVIAAGVHVAGTDTADGALVDLVHDHIDPALVAGDELRSAGAQILILREQGLDVVDAVLKSIIVLLSVELHSTLKSANALELGAGDDLSLSGMAQGGCLIILRLLENIAFHSLVSSFGFVRMFDVAVILRLFATIVGIAVGHGIGKQSNNNRLLLFSQAVDNILNGIAVFGVFLFVVAISGLLAIIGSVVSFAFVCVSERDWLVGTEDNFLLRTLSMSKIDKVNECSGICTGNHKAQLLDVAMHYVAALLLQAVCIDGQGIHIAMLHDQLGCLAGRGIVESAVSVNAILAVFQQRMTQDIGRVIVLVIPDEGDGLSVAMSKRITADGAAITAHKIIARCPAAEVVLKFLLHFDCCPPSVLMPAYFPPVRSDCCCAARPPLGRKKASCRSSAGSRSRS